MPGLDDLMGPKIYLYETRQNLFKSGGPTMGGPHNEQQSFLS